MPDAATEARELVRIVRDDAGLPEAVRRAAGQLAPLASANPDLALERLSTLREAALGRLTMSPPEIDYARCISIEVFWRFNLSTGVRESFASPQDYRRWIESDPDSAGRLSTDLGPQSVVPAANSWLVPRSLIAGLSGSQTKVRLNFEQSPPYVVMVFSVARMIAAGVEVRVPRGVDAIPSRLVQWYPDNVPDERIDRDKPRAALEVIEWRP